MTNLKTIAATLAVLGTGTLVGCKNDKGSTEVPGGAEAPATETPAIEAPTTEEATEAAGEASCGAKGEESHGEGSCGGAK